jgi:DNA primase
LKQLKQEVAKNGKVKVLIICAGQKDCLSLYGSIGIRGIALNSESASITKELFIELLQYAENILVCYDNDETGIKNAAKIKQDIGIDNIFLGDISPAHDVNDLYDYFSKQYDKQSFLNLIESKIC